MSEMLRIEAVAGKGRGTVASRCIARGTTIEVAPVCPLPESQQSHIDKTDLRKYYFVRSRQGDGRGESAYIVFGLSSLCNHSDRPNARVEWHDDTLGTWVHLVALEDIERGQEVTFSYTNIEDYPVESFL